MAPGVDIPLGGPVELDEAQALRHVASLVQFFGLVTQAFSSRPLTFGRAAEGATWGVL